MGVFVHAESQNIANVAGKSFVWLAYTYTDGFNVEPKGAIEPWPTQKEWAWDLKGGAQEGTRDFTDFAGTGVLIPNANKKIDLKLTDRTSYVIALAELDRTARTFTLVDYIMYTVDLNITQTTHLFGETERGVTIKVWLNQSYGGGIDALTKDDLWFKKIKPSPMGWKSPVKLK